MEIAEMKPQEKTAKAGTCRGLECVAETKLANDSTATGDRIKRPGRVAIMESEALALEAAAAILAESTLTNAGPAVERLGRGLELLLRREAERSRVQLRHGKSLAALFPDHRAAA